MDNPIRNFNHLFFAVTFALLVSCATNIKAQEHIQKGEKLPEQIDSDVRIHVSHHGVPGMGVPIMATWKKGDTKRLLVRMETEEYEDAYLIKKSGSKYDVLLTVTDETSSGYTIEWRLGILRFLPEPGLELEDFSAKEFVRMIEGLRIIYRTDVFGAFAELVNRDEMQKHMIGFLDNYLAAKRRITPGGEERFEAIAPEITLLKDFFSSKEMIEVQYTKEIQLFHGLYGRTFRVKEPWEEVGVLPNILGGPPLLGKVRGEMKDLSPDGKYCKIELHMELDLETLKESTREFTDRMMKQMGKVSSQPTSSLPSDLDLENEIKYEIDLQSGWVKKMKSTREQRSGSKRTLLTVEISHESNGEGDIITAVETELDFISRGVTYFRRKQYDQAISDFSKALELNPKYSFTYVNRGLAYDRKGLSDQAISDYSKALEINPKDYRAYFYRGYAYGRKGQDEQAISDYTKAIELNPKYAEAYNNRGIAYQRKSQHDQAILDYSKVIELNPNYALAYYNRGTGYWGKSQNDQAILDLTKAIELNPKYAPAYNLLAWLYATAIEPRLRNGEKGVELALKACELSGWKNPSYLDTLAAAYARTGDFNNAIKWQEKTLDFPDLRNRTEVQQRLDLYRKHRPWPVD